MQNNDLQVIAPKPHMTVRQLGKKLFKILCVYCIIFTFNTWLSNFYPDEVDLFLDTIESYIEPTEVINKNIVTI